MRITYKDIAREDFVRDLENLRFRYYTQFDEKSYKGNLTGSFVDLMYRLIEELESYIGYGANIRAFESKFAAGKDSYVIKKRKELKEKHKGKDVSTFYSLRKDIWEKTWESEAKKSEYFAMLGIVEFIEKVEDVLNNIQVKNEYIFKTSNALNQLTGKESGIPKIDMDNRKLRIDYNRMIEEDIRIFKAKQMKKIEESINLLRKTALYKNKLRSSDSRHIGNDSSLTFTQLFDKLRYYANDISLDTKTDALPEDTNELIDSSNYIEKIDKLGSLVTDLEYKHAQTVKERQSYTFTIEENEELERLSNDVSSKIYEIRNIYEKINSKKEEYRKILLYVSGLKLRLSAIDTAIETLSDDVNIYPPNSGKSVFQNTIKLLQEERNNCIKALNKYQDITDLLDKLFNEATDIISNIDSLNNGLYVIINRGKERKHKEDVEKGIAKQELEARKEALSEEKRRELIDKIKEDVIRELTKEGHSPDLINFDGERAEESYAEFNKLFRSRLMMALNEQGIEYTEGDLSNPRDVSETNEIPKLSKDGFLFTMNDVDYECLFNYFEKKLIDSGNEYQYDDVLDMIREHLGSTYGDDIGNKSEIKDIIKRHRSSYEEKDKGHSI